MKVFFCVLVMLSLAGCPTTTSRTYHQHPSQIEVQNYISSNLQPARDGHLPWSLYYDGLYKIYQVSPELPNHAAEMLSLNNLIKYSHQYEKSEISKEEFEYLQREQRAQSSLYATQQILKQKEIDANQEMQERAIILKQMEIDAINNQTRTIRNQNSKPINTNCVRQGNYTNCTTY